MSSPLPERVGSAHTLPSPPPTLQPQKGGGALRGMGEKFTANPVTGTGSLAVPIPVSPGRSSFGPQLTLSYDSGSGNGPFGFGWSLSLPNVSRKTDKGVPLYLDLDDSDTFLLSGAEDLVPLLGSPDTVSVPGFAIRRYRPRTEGLFARIERWTADDGDTHWRSFSRDNILSIYGLDDDSRIADPDDDSLVFTWLLCETRDDRGNAISYTYLPGTDGVNRFVQSIHYGNRNTFLDGLGRRSHFVDDLLRQNADWMFEVAFDYEPRPDPFSSRRAGFEVRTDRLCRRVRMVHHFQGEPTGAANQLIHSTNFSYSHDGQPQDERQFVYVFLEAVMHTGHDGQASASLPPLEFEYSEVRLDPTIREVDAASLENLPEGLGGGYRWVDLDGEGLSGVLSEQGGAWWYKRNRSSIPVERADGVREVVARFAPAELVALRPGIDLADGAQFLDLAGDGRPDVATLRGPTPGFYERTSEGGWEGHVSFESLPILNWDDPNLRFVDLDGDGLADVLITQGDCIVWHRSLGERGWSAAQRVYHSHDEEKGPRVVFADGTESIHLADISGDGLTDLVRVRNGAVCYWPSLGHGRFGAKVVMGNAPWFDSPDVFDPRRLLLADIDGSGTTDLIYLGTNSVRVFFNQSGNAWSEGQELPGFGLAGAPASVTAIDLLGNGTACLVWSSPLLADAGRCLRYIDLMGGQKPHLLTRVVNNLGAETVVNYVPSTRFYLEDRDRGDPWVTRLPFPVHVVESVETHDRVSGNRFVTRYAYHHGYFDGEEREFRGFGMVEQSDTERFAVNEADPDVPHVPPVHTKTWFHTGVFFGAGHVGDHFAGEYYREPGQTPQEAKAALLDDSVLPGDLSALEQREACRALKGAMLRQEVYLGESKHPCLVTEQNFAVRRLQVPSEDTPGVYLTHPSESLNYHYERDPADPRVRHVLTLEVDKFGNVLKEVAVGYGRRKMVRVVNPQSGVVTLMDNPALAALPSDEDRSKQTTPLLSYTENVFTDEGNLTTRADAYRTPMPCETSTYELTGMEPAGERFGPQDFAPAGPRRLIEHVRTVYRSDDLKKYLLLGTLDAKALPGESYKLAFTPEILSQTFKRPRPNQPDEDLLPDPVAVLGGQGGYRRSQDLRAAGLFPAAENDGNWWVPTGRVFFSQDPGHDANAELTHAIANFFLPCRFRDPFAQTTTVTYDGHKLLVTRTTDPVGNVVLAENDYRVLRPTLITDPNGNRTAASFDALGMVVATAVMGKANENVGDLLQDAEPNPPLADLRAFAADPFAHAADLLGKATTRIVYDLDRFRRCGQPAFSATLARHTHHADPGGAQSKIQVSFSYSDGFGREVQKKIQAEPGQAPQRQAQVTTPEGDARPGKLIPGSDGKPVQAQAPRRWVGTGRTVFNNKGKPVKQYEPFFSATHLHEPEPELTDTGVTPMLFYDPLDRVVVTLHPNHTYEKAVFDPWRQLSHDVNDTVKGDPRNDPDVKEYVEEYFKSQPPGWQTWQQQRASGAKGTEEQDAAAKAAKHADTPSTVHLDALGRPFLTAALNRFERKPPGGIVEDAKEIYHTRSELDIEGNQLSLSDARGRIVVTYDYDMLGNRVHQASMEAGRRWVLNDVTGKPIRSWDSRGHATRIEYDPLRRPLRTLVVGADPAQPAKELLTELLVYGERHPDAEEKNLRGRAYLHLDQAGVVTSDEFDFKGNSLAGSRRLAKEYKNAIDWTPVNAVLPADATRKLSLAELAAVAAVLTPLAEQETFTHRTRYDALNRAVQMIPPHSDETKLNVVQPAYNDAGLLERVDVWLSVAEPTTLLDPATVPPEANVGVGDIDYDAKGQRLRIEYKNGVATDYDYDPETYRLTRLHTRRGPAFNDTCQDLHYTYDPVGNIVHVRDDAQQPIFFDNAVVEPHGEYTYDAVYRLVEAKGREHLSQGAPVPHSHDDSLRTNLPHPSDGAAMGNYTEAYEYDEVGNILKMQHGTWTRAFNYNEASQLGGAAKNNRLSSTVVNSGPAQEYHYDAHGNTTQMPHLASVQWDHKDQMRQADLGGGGTVYFTYDAAGQRVRKVWEKSPGVTEERIYLGGFEVFRRRNGGGAVVLQRETLHVTDDKQRVSLVEERTKGNEPGVPARLVRYQMGNHLGSAVLELDDAAEVVSYEEYAPYGSTTYQAVRGQTEAKRYRYTGKERDGETGLYYHGARYYAPWLGRWTACDPAGFVDGPNRYQYVGGNPTRKIDPTGTQEADLNEALTGAIDQLDRPGNPFQAHGKAGLKETPLTMDIDEPRAVGERGITPAEARARALDVNNRQFLDPKTNRVTKYLGTETRAASPPGALASVTENPGILLTRRFGDIAEMRDVFQEALGKIKDPSKLTPTALKERINSNMWEIIKTGQGDAATKARAALESLGFENVNGQGYVMKTQQAAAVEPTKAVVAAASEAQLPVQTTTLPTAGAAPGRLARAATWTAETAPKVLRVAGQILTVVGAGAEANRTIEFERRHNRGELNAQLMGMATFAVGVAAGVVDDAHAAAQMPMMGAPVLTLNSWEQHGSGPFQHAAGEAIRSFLGWGFRQGL